jgi:hypothetical protein
MKKTVTLLRIITNLGRCSEERMLERPYTFGWISERRLWRAFLVDIWHLLG